MIRIKTYKKKETLYSKNQPPKSWTPIWLAGCQKLIVFKTIKITTEKNTPFGWVFTPFGWGKLRLFTGLCVFEESWWGFSVAIAPNHDVDFTSGWNTKNIKTNARYWRNFLGALEERNWEGKWRQGMNAPGGCNQHQNHIFWRFGKKGPLEKAFFWPNIKKNCREGRPRYIYIVCLHFHFWSSQQLHIQGLWTRGCNMVH